MTRRFLAGKPMTQQVPGNDLSLSLRLSGAAMPAPAAAPVECPECPECPPGDVSYMHLLPDHIYSDGCSGPFYSGSEYTSGDGVSISLEISGELPEAKFLTVVIRSSYNNPDFDFELTIGGETITDYVDFGRPLYVQTFELLTDSSTWTGYINFTTSVDLLDGYDGFGLAQLILHY